MKIGLSLLSSRLKALFGFGEKINIKDGHEINGYDVDAIYEEWNKQVGSGGYTIRDMNHPVMLTDIANIKLSYGNYKSSQKLCAAIQRFDRNSTRLTRWMLILSVIMTVLVGVQVVLAVRLWRHSARTEAVSSTLLTEQDEHTLATEKKLNGLLEKSSVREAK